jgi:AraC-like DNA-binding protein
MRQASGIVTRGILRPVAGLERFQLTRVEPPADLAPFVTLFWTARWDLAESETYEQEVLPFLAANLAWESEGYLVHGVCTERFVAKLSGRGSVTAVRFTPAGFSAFSRVPVRTLVNRVVPARDVIGRVPPPAPASPEEARERLTEYLRAHGAVRSRDMELADRVVERAQASARDVTAAGLAADAGISVRSLHRLLERHVGVGTKSIVRRTRVQDAAERVARGERVDWATVAQELGYHDQAHLIRDFRAQVGDTPAAYAKRCHADGATLLRPSTVQAERTR